MGGGGEGMGGVFASPTLGRWPLITLHSVVTSLPGIRKVNPGTQSPLISPHGLSNPLTNVDHFLNKRTPWIDRCMHELCTLLSIPGRRRTDVGVPHWLAAPLCRPGPVSGC